MTRFTRTLPVVVAMCLASASVAAQEAGLSGLLAEARTIQRVASTLSASISRLLDEARKNNESTRVTCLSRKLSEANAKGRTLEQRMKALVDAVELNDESGANHQMTVFRFTDQQLSQIGQAAARCVGQNSLDGAGSQVTTTIPENAPTDDPTSVSADAPGVAPSVSVPQVLSARLPTSM